MSLFVLLLRNAVNEAVAVSVVTVTCSLPVFSKLETA